MSAPDFQALSSRHDRVALSKEDQVRNQRVVCCQCGMKFFGDDGDLNWRKHRFADEGVPDVASLLVASGAERIGLAEEFFKTLCKQLKGFETQSQDRDFHHIKNCYQAMYSLREIIVVSPLPEEPGQRHRLERLRSVVTKRLSLNPAPVAARSALTPVVLNEPAASEATLAPATPIVPAAARIVVASEEEEEEEDDDDDDDDDENNDDDDNDDHDDDAINNEDAASADWEHLEEHTSFSSPVLQLEYTLGESFSSEDPSVRVLCCFRREYNDATIRLHTLEGHTPYPMATATSELQRLHTLLKCIQQARPLTASATSHSTGLSLEFRKLEELVSGQIGELCDRLELPEEPSSRTEVADSFDLAAVINGSVTAEPDGTQDQLALVDDDACHSQPCAIVETTPHKEDCVHRGILFQYLP